MMRGDTWRALFGARRPRLPGRPPIPAVLLALALAVILAACAGGGPPPDYPKPHSTAFAEPRTTTLGQKFGAPFEADPALSGFSLLIEAREAFIARLALAAVAERSLDMQYYIWDGDTTGRIIVDRVMRAADRGVQVRLLVDDPFYAGVDDVIATLDVHPNVEIRLYNPVASRRWYALDFLTDFSRVNRRMHNKLMVADNAAAIIGGRNIGDIYYGVNTAHNYRDLDVLAVGPIVRDLSGTFDRYWNSTAAVPIVALMERTYDEADLAALRARLEETIAAADYPYPIDQELAELAARTAELRQSLVWAPGRIIADDPEAPARGEASDDVVQFLSWQVGQVEHELLVESPYLVLPAPTQATVKALTERGVRVQMLTNSLASNDVVMVHAGYAKTRRRLLENGMDIYELRPDTEAYSPGWSIVAKGSRAALHSKALAFDRKAVFIGSFNLDPRSAVINTEAGLYIESPELAEQLAAFMADGITPANSFHVFLDEDGRMVWETERDGATARYTHDPDTGFGRRFMTDLFALLPIDGQL